LKAKALNKEVVIESISRQLETFNTIQNALLARMRNATTVEEIMELKQQMLLNCVDDMPLSSSSCYFCLLNIDCSKCPYGALHGICAEEESDFRKVCIAKENLKEALYNYHHQDDKYKTVLLKRKTAHK
jgi:hypothetical protein